MANECPDCGSQLRARRPNHLVNIRRREIESRYDKFVCPSCNETWAKEEVVEEPDTNLSVMEWMDGVEKEEVSVETGFEDFLKRKDWIAEDDDIIKEEVTDPSDEDHVVEEFYWWVTETYITAAQRKMAFEDDDVELGVLEDHDEDGFGIAVYDDR